jgi:isovaleryl-CoA dehydrogenase
MSCEPTGAADFDLATPTEEHRELRAMLCRFVRDEIEPQANEHNRNETFNDALFRRLGDLGLFGVTVPEDLGGAGMDATAACIVCEELSTSDPGLALSCLAQGLLFVNNFVINANDEQRGRLLDRVLSGEWLAGLCMTEPEAGTDVPGGMRCRAHRDGDAYLLNGEKTFITNGCRDGHTPGDIFLVYAKTGESLSTFIIERGLPGFSLGSKLQDKLGMRKPPRQ